MWYIWIMSSAAACPSFREILERPEPEIDLAAAALAIAREEYPGLDPGAFLARLDEAAALAMPGIRAACGNPFAIIDALNRCLYDELGFRGNEENYFDPRNSYLNEVLDRKRGIPITLSIVTMEVARRVGFALEGVGFPGHFIVRHVAGDREILIDPFHRGEILLLEDCKRLLRRSYGSRMAIEPRFFEAVGVKAILGRLLTNLKYIYMRDSDYPRALRVIEQLIALLPDEPRHRRDRGVVQLRLGRYSLAVDDLERYLRAAPKAKDAAEVRKQIVSIHRLTAMLS